MAQNSPGTARRSGLGIGAILIVLALFLLMRSFGGNDAPGAVPAEQEDVAAPQDAPSADSAFPQREAAVAAEPAANPAVAAFEEAVAESAARAPDGMPLIMLNELPPEAIDTLRLIAEDGPFPYDADGGPFENREGLLPDEPNGYYAQYTVETPGVSGRGERRIVAGDGAEYYYTDDFFESFAWIVLAEPVVGEEQSVDSAAAASDAARDEAIAASAERAPRGMPLIMLDELPPEAIETLVLIANDGPFPYDKDGSTFQNREGILPSKPNGYYAEYTVETPGSPDRGARRIVAGENAEYYYTDDHYSSFSWIVLVE